MLRLPAFAIVLVSISSLSSGQDPLPSRDKTRSIGARSRLFQAICADTIQDATTGVCIEADSTPTLGKLFPLGPQFNIDPGTGNIGIGTLAPGRELDVAGTARVTGFELPTGAAAGSVLVSDANGVGSWQRGHDLGQGNVALGPGTLVNLTSGNSNTAGGALALFANTSGRLNTGIGNEALQDNTIGFGNTANGHRALRSNTTGRYNTAAGAYALSSNTTGNYNIAIGDVALFSNTTGRSNVATGNLALAYNTTGYRNAAFGGKAQKYNTTGLSNTAVGFKALYYNKTGHRNIAVGYRAGLRTDGGENIVIGNQGVAGESGSIRIGTGGIQTRTYVAGIRGSMTGAANAIAVLVDGNGQLGTVSSARRFKEEIRDMADSTERLLDLRPVLFRYKQAFADGEKPVQYGLIAEEVAEVFPELVVYDEDGEPYTVKYHLLSSMLLNELQKQVERDKVRARELRALEERLGALEVLAASGPPAGR